MPLAQRQEPKIGHGVLNENFNKRSEASNRKYRAFLHFLKYEKTQEKKADSRPGSASKTEKKGDPSTPKQDGQQIDELTDPDADDDFDDRYIHLIAAHSEINKASGIISPDTTHKGIWDLICLVFIVYQSIIIPFRLCFDYEAAGGWAYLEGVIDVWSMVRVSI